MAQTGDAPQDLELRPGTGRGTAGYFRAGQTPDGRWWLIDPAGRPFFFRGVNEVHGLDGSPHEPAARLRRGAATRWAPGRIRPRARRGCRGSGRWIFVQPAR